MSEGFIEKFVSSVHARLFFVVLFGALLSAGAVWTTFYYIGDQVLQLCLIATSVLLTSYLIALAFTRMFTKPTEYLARAILHVSPSQHLVTAPNVEELRLGRELVSSLVRQVYDFATTAEHMPQQTRDTVADTIFRDLPVAVIGFHWPAARSASRPWPRRSASLATRSRTCMSRS